jgi:hypothetical protein
VAPALVLSGVAFWLLFLVIAWRAWKLCADRIPNASGGDWPPPWCASIGDGSGSDARDPEHPDPLEIDDIMRWRPAILLCQARDAVARELRRESAVEAHQMARRRRRWLAGRRFRLR